MRIYKFHAKIRLDFIDNDNELNLIVNSSNHFLQENYQTNNELTITSAFMFGLGSDPI